MLIYLTTDSHFFHSKIIEYENRPIDFEYRIHKGLRQIPEDALLIHLGDLCIGQDKFAIELMRVLKCRKILVRGNHDKKSLGFYLKGFDAVVDTMTLNVFGKTILFSHKPQPDGDYDLNIHGHCHSKERIKEFEPTMHSKQKLLAIENTNYLPVSLEKFIYG
jgi:calcineurin-like phosphoesterase family protein